MSRGDFLSMLGLDMFEFPVTAKTTQISYVLSPGHTISAFGVPAPSGLRCSVRIHGPEGPPTLVDAFGTGNDADDVRIVTLGTWRNMLLEPRDARQFHVREKPLPIVWLVEHDRPLEVEYEAVGADTELLICLKHEPYTPPPDRDP